MTAKRATILALEGIGILLALFGILIAFVFWRMQSGPISLNAARPMVESAIETTVGQGVDADVEAITLSSQKDGWHVTLTGVGIRNAGENSDLFLPHILLTFAPSNFFSGKIGPRIIVVEKPRLRIVRRDDQRFTIDYGGESQNQPANVFSTLTGGRYFREAFERADLKGANIEFVDELTGRSWLADNAFAFIERDGERYRAKIEGTFNIENKKASLVFDAWFDPETEIISADLVVDQAPIGDLIATFLGGPSDMLSAPISGKASLDISSEGRILSSYLTGDAGQGAARIAGRTVEINSISAAAAFDPVANKFDIEALNIDSDVLAARITGTIGLGEESAAPLSHVSFELVGEAPRLAPGDFFEGPLAIGTFDLRGSFLKEKKTLQVSSLFFEIGENIFSGTGTYQGQSGTSPGIVANASATGTLSKTRLMKLWPRKLALGARDFVEERVFGAELSGLEFQIDLPAGHFAALGHVPDEAMKLEFAASDATVHYVPGMTPLRGLQGKGVLGGNSFLFTASEGSVGRIRLRNGEVDIPNIRPRAQKSYYRFKAAGDAKDVLALIDQKPLSFLSSTPLGPEQFEGDVDLDIEIMRPNANNVLRREYEYRGVANFQKLKVENFYRDVSLEAGEGKLSLEPKSMTVIGNAKFGETPITIDWKQSFFGSGDRTKVAVSGVADSTTADLFGIPTRKFIRGAVPFIVNASGGLGQFRTIDLNATLDDATVLIDPLSWRKAAGSPLNAAISFQREGSGFDLPSIHIEGDGVNINGNATFGTNGQLSSATFSKILLEGSADITASVERDALAYQFAVTGNYFDISPFIEAYFERPIGNGPDADSATINGHIRLDHVLMRNDVSYRDVSVDLRRQSGQINEFDLAGLGENGHPLNASLKRTGIKDGPNQVVVARTEDVGSLLSGLFGVSSVAGGQGVLEFYADDRVDGQLAGKLEARDIKIVNAPLLAKIFAAGSLEGLNALLNDNGIEISQAFANVAFGENGIEISDARAAGPSLGITARGVLRGSGNKMALSGAVAPVYSVNSFLGKTPIIGDLFVSREGEGVLALTYDIEGSPQEPIVSVNPLSALTPGFLRRVFDTPESVDPDDIKTNKEVESTNEIQ